MANNKLSSLAALRIFSDFKLNRLLQPVESAGRFEYGPIKFRNQHDEPNWNCNEYGKLIGIGKRMFTILSGNVFSETSQLKTLPLEIDVSDVKQILDSGTEALLIDCREPEEHKFARIDGSVLIPMYETPDRLAEIEPHRQKRIIVHCHHGRRSMQVVQWLRQQGFEKAQSMADGIEAWSEFVDPTVPRY